MFTLGAAKHCFALDVLDYQDKNSPYRQDKNQLHVSIQVKDEDRSSMITAGLLATHELSTLGNWFGQVASGASLAPVVLLEPGLLFTATMSDENQFTVRITMSALASPTWAETPFYAEPFDMQFHISYDEMILAARQLQELHRQFPTQ
ncbi:WapI family immunity protein [Spirosoma pomorum]